VATALQTYFQSYLQTQAQLVQTQVISPQELVNRQVFVVGETTTNSVLVSASPALFDVALALIERLDRRPPMVTVQVVIAEIQLDDQLELGAEFGLQDSLLFTRTNSSRGTLASPTFNNLTGGTSGNNVASQGLSAFGVGRGNTAGVGGLVLAASSESVGMLMRALQTAGRLQVLNRPTLTTLENREATSQVGARVPRVSGVSQGTLNNPQQITTADVDVGLLLQINPRVSPDGLIVMDVGVENSSVGDPDLGIPVGFATNGTPIRSPIISRTTAQTVVSAYSGQTVVFAGLISKNRKTSRSQIPFLGSLPLIGAAFRFDIESEQRKELLVVLTPRIVQTDEDYENLKQIESSRMSWCLADVVNIHGDVGLSGGNGLWGPARGGMMYPDRPAIKVPDRAPVDLNNNYPMYGGQDYCPGVEIPGPIESAPSIYEDLNVSKERQLQLQQASYRQQADAKPIPPNQPATNNGKPATSAGAGVQKGSYQ
jgi:type II secretory pathway component GspD/PulD (secretin)